MCIFYTYTDYSNINHLSLQLEYKYIYTDKTKEVFLLKNDNIKNSINYEKLGLRIKEARLNKNLTQENIADYVGCNVSHISNIENNHTKVSLNALLAIANALNTSIDSLLSEQYDNSSLALDNAIIKALKDLDYEKKLSVLKIISII